MREIKFRGKRRDDIWVCGSLVIGTDGKSTYIFTLEGAQWSVLPESVGQYTGLKDKNGKEVFDGDILECTSELLTNFGRTKTGTMSTTHYQVIWHKEGWGKKVIKSKQLVLGFESNGLEISLKYSSVIGKIYENDEYLELARSAPDSTAQAQAVEGF